MIARILVAVCNASTTAFVTCARARTTVAASLFATLVPLSGCHHTIAKSDAVMCTPALRDSLLPKSQGPTDAQYRCACAMLPDLGGLYLDEDGTPTVVLRDVSKVRAAVAALYAAGLGNYDVRRLRAVHGEYSYTQLSDWQKALSAVVFRIPGVTHIGQDLRHNRLNIGAMSEEAKAQLRGTVAKLGIPNDAVVYEPGRIFRPLHSVPSWRPPADQAVGSAAGPRTSS